MGGLIHHDGNASYTPDPRVYRALAVVSELSEALVDEAVAASTLYFIDVRRFAREGIGLDLLEDDGVTDALPLPLAEPVRGIGVDVPLPPVPPTPPCPGGAGAKTDERLILNIFVVIQPSQVAACAARSRSSRFLSKALRYLS